MLDEFLALEQEYEGSLPPVHLWNPELNGDIDIRIDREGRWFHEGEKIQREALIRLFGSILKQEGEEYYLVTPVEKWRITVDVAPLFVVSMRMVDGLLLFTTNMGNEIAAGKDHPITVNSDEAGNPTPLIVAQRGLRALLGRAVFYQLAESATVEVDSEGECMVVYSAGERFVLGRC